MAGSAGGMMKVCCTVFFLEVDDFGRAKLQVELTFVGSRKYRAYG